MDIPLRSAFDLEKDFSCMICGRGAMAKKRCPGRVGLYWLQMQGGLHSCAKATKQPATNRAVAVAGNLYQTLEMLPFIQSSAFMSEVLHGMFCSCLLYNSVIPKMSLFFHSLHSLRDSQFLQESIGINRLLLGICLNHNLPYLQYPFECQLANPALFSLATLCRNEA